MKKMLLGSLLLLISTGVEAQRTEITNVVQGLENIVITTKRNSPTSNQNEESGIMLYQIVTDTTVSSGNKWKFECPFLLQNQTDPKDRGCKNFTGLKDIYWGWNFNFNHKNGIKNCFEVGVGEVFGLSFSPWKNGPTIDVGIGFGMRRYLVQNGLRFEGMDNILKIEDATGMHVDRSRVDSWTFHIPIMFTQNVYKKLAVSLGTWINFNTYVKGETRFNLDNVRITEYYKGFNQRLCTLDIVAVVGIRNGIGFYSRISPMSLFDDCKGPEFRSVSMGVMLNF